MIGVHGGRGTVPTVASAPAIVTFCSTACLHQSCHAQQIALQIPLMNMWNSPEILICVVTCFFVGDTQRNSAPLGCTGSGGHAMSAASNARGQCGLSMY